MKLKSNEDAFVLTNSNNEKKFTIAATGQAFKILSSALYSRKVEAIVRELSCNAYDSHVFASTPDKQFHVHLPTVWEPEFWIEDFGVGLDKDDVESIYTSYFTSTKTDSNDVIGGLGLGSKTPFAYTDSFNLVTRKNGKEYSYSAYINTRGEPSVSLLAECDTDQPNGVRVTVPVAQKDFYEFESSAKKVYAYFRTLPQFIGKELNVSQIDFEELDTRGYLMLETHRKNNIYVIMGNVCYEVTNVAETFDQQLSKTSAHYIRQICLAIKFDIGDLDVAASRENISFDEVTTKTFIEKVEEVCATLIKDAQAKIDRECTTPGDAIYFTQTYVGKWAMPSLRYKGYTLEDLYERRIGEVLIDMVTEHYQPKFFPKQIFDTNGKAVIDSNTKLPMFTKFDHYDYIHNHTFFFKRGRSSLVVGSTDYSGHTFKSFSSNSKIFIFQGTNPGYEAAAKDYTRANNDYHVGTYMVQELLPDELKSRISDFFGSTVVFLDSDEEIANRKARIKESREKKKEDKVAKAKKDRIKKNQVKVLDTFSIELEYGKYVTKSYGYLEIDVDTFGNEPFLLLTKFRNSYKVVPKNDTEALKYRDIDRDHIDALLLMTGIDKAFVLHENNSKDIERLVQLSSSVFEINDKIKESVAQDTYNDAKILGRMHYFFARNTPIKVDAQFETPFLKSLIEERAKNYSKEIEWFDEFRDEFVKCSNISRFKYSSALSLSNYSGIYELIEKRYNESVNLSNMILEPIFESEMLSHLYDHSRLDLMEHYLEISQKKDLNSKAV